MSRLVKIAGWGGAPRASVIFIHGLGGHAYDTWRRGTKTKPPADDTFWPLWLSKDVEGLSVYALAYEAPPSNWLGTSMPLQDRAVNVLEILLSEPGLRTGSIAFICHSLGGLIVKQLLLDLHQQKERRPELADLLERVTQVVFAATPHTGSRQGTLLDRLRFFAWPSSIARTLVANDPALRSINVAYRGLADERRTILRHRIFYETQGTPAGVIVDEASSDPGLPGDPPVPVDANHISIVKPFDRSSILYARTRDFLVKHNPAPETQEGALEICPLLLPKAIRIAAIGLVILIGRLSGPNSRSMCRGVQALITPVNIGPTPEKIKQIQEPSTKQLDVKDAQIAALNAQNAALTKMLLEKNPVAGPGAQKAVGEAVQSIAQGASEGDPRLKQAFALLKENKTAEAAELLNAVAKDKTAHAEQAATQAEQAAAQAEKDRKEAAVAYRNLGAIAALRDPKRALEAYEKAAGLDPDDLESLLGIGWIQIDYGDLNEAQARLERVLKLANTDDQAFYKYWALTGLGDVLVAQGNLPEALKSYQAGLAIRDRLATSDPGNARWQRDLSISFGKLALVHKQSGDKVKARDFLRQGQAIMARLTKLSPDNAQWKQDLALFDRQIKDLGPQRRVRH